MTLAPGYIGASYAGVDLMVATISTPVGLDVVTHSPARGDKHVNQIRGLKHKAAQLRLLFIDQPGKPNYILRAQQFQGATEIPAASSFSHPVLGTYMAIAADVEMIATDEMMVEFSCRMLPEDEPQVTFPAGAGVSVGAGSDATNVAATNATNALTAAGLSSDTPTSCASTVSAWAEIDTDLLDSQQVFLEVATLTAQIDSDIDTLEMESDLDLWLAYQAYILLRFQVVRAAQAATANADKVFDFIVGQPRPLLAICSDIYGPALAQQRWQDVINLNRVRTPGLLPAGTSLKMPSDGAA